MSVAATAAALEFQNEAPLGDRIKGLSRAAARRIAYDTLKDPTSGQMDDALREAEERGLPIRSDAEQKARTEAAKAWRQRMVTQLGIADPPLTLENPVPSLGTIGLHATPASPWVERLRAAEPRPVTPPAQLDRLLRMRSLLEAVSGLIDPDTPISRISRLFDEMIDSLNEKPD